MLKIMRRRLKLILWTMIVAFGLWGIGTALSIRQGPRLAAGTLFGRPVPLQAYQAAHEAARHRALLAFGTQAEQVLSPPEVERQAWDWLLLVTAAQRAGVRTSDQEVVETIAQWPIFQRNGRFDPRTYEAVVRYSLGTTPRAFEEEVRGQRSIQKLFDRATGSLEATEPELEQAYREEHDAIRAAYVLVGPDQPHPDAAAANLVATAQEGALQGLEDPLTPAARAMGLTVTRTEFVTRASPIGETTAGARLGPAFPLAVGAVGGPWQTTAGWVVARVVDRKPLDQEAFAAAREPTRARVLARKRTAALERWLQQLRAQGNPTPHPTPP